MDFGSIGAGAAGGAVVAIVIRASDEFSSTFGKATEGLGGLQSFSMGVTGSMLALGAGVAVAAGALGEFAIKAAEAGDVQEAFNKLAGENGVDALNKMADATLHTMSNVELMKTANDALIKGMSTEDLPTLSKYAQQLSDMGKGNVAENIDTITQAFATGRTAQLKALGVNIDLNAEYKKYAESIGIVNDAKGTELKTQEAAIQKQIDYYESIGGSRRMLSQLKDELKANQEEQKKNVTSTSDFNSILDETQKKAALHGAIMEGVAASSAKLPEPTIDAADSVKQLGAAWENAQVEIGNAITPMIESISTKLLPVFKEMYNFFNEHILPAFQLLFDAFGSLMGEFGGSNEFVTVFFKAIGYAIEGVVTFIALIIKGVSYILQWANVIYQWGEIIVSTIKDKVIASFNLLSNTWTLTKDMFLLGVLDIELGVEKMANMVIDSFQKSVNAIVNFVNTAIDMYNKVANKLGWGEMGHIGGLDLSGLKFNTSALEGQISALKGEATAAGNQINISIGQLSGVNPDDMANALRTKLNDLVST